MVVNNCEANLVPINLKIEREERNKFYSCISSKGLKASEVLRKCISKCIAEPDDFLNYLFEKE